MGKERGESARDMRERAREMRERARKQERKGDTKNLNLKAY